METILSEFRQRLFTAPQPVALALGRVCRHHDSKELVETGLKAGEVLARYLAALALSSFCAREGPSASIAVPNELREFRGNLSFGHFLSVLKGIARHPATHPLKASLQATFGSGGKGEKAFDDLVALRNKIGHKLAALTEAKAQQILQRDEPVERLSETLQASQRLLDLPLFLLEEQAIARKVVRGRRLLLMGDGEPTPDFIEMTEALEEVNALYVGLNVGALRLPPFLLWAIVKERASFGLYLLHRAEPKKVDYLTVYDDELVEPTAAGEFETLTAGGLRPVESVILKDDGDLLSHWLGQKKVRERAAQPNFGPIPWKDLNDATLRWYDELLLDSAMAQDTRKKPGVVMAKRLLDGRDILSTDELQQLVLLFGKEKAVAQLLRRPMVDCRARKQDSTERWDDRKESTANVLESLKMAISFFSRHIGVQGATIDGLKATTGSADYIAMREALVNLFIHQDYSSPGVAGQVEIRDDRTVFHNAGMSLVNAEGLLEGGKSTSRNAIISRALRLIGFAELAGSGLYAVHTAWRKAHRRPPKFESNAQANTFTLTLDWRPLEVRIDEFWKQKLGVRLSPEQAGILSVLVTPEPFTLEQIASAAGLYLADAKAATDYLKLQTLIMEIDGKFALRPDLMQLAANRDQTAD
jgi:hypothetical protein